MGDSHYVEADGEHTAGGRRMAAYERDRCQATLLAGFSSVFECALPVAHEGSHESMGGSSWNDPPGEQWSAQEGDKVWVMPCGAMLARDLDLKAEHIRACATCSSQLPHDAQPGADHD